MPEGSREAAILIATSWQALNRATQGKEETQLCDCTIVILFAGFFIESNLNDIIDRLGRTSDMKNFLKNDYPGLQDKLAWYYNEYVARKKAGSKKAFKNQKTYQKIRQKFPGFAEIYRFRNDISHGVINNVANSLEKTKILRQQAKDIVETLFEIADKAGHSIKRDTTYLQAIDFQRK